MTQRLEVLWHREIGDRLLVALEEEPAVPSGTRVELVQKCPQCHGEGFYEVIADPYVVGCVTCGGAARGPNGSGVVSLGVATLEEVVPWVKVRASYASWIVHPFWRDERHSMLFVPVEHYDELFPLSPKYVALCEVKK